MFETDEHPDYIAITGHHGLNLDKAFANVVDPKRGHGYGSPIIESMHWSISIALFLVS